MVNKGRRDGFSFALYLGDWVSEKLDRPPFIFFNKVTKYSFNGAMMVKWANKQQMRITPSMVRFFGPSFKAGPSFACLLLTRVGLRLLKAKKIITTNSIQTLPNQTTYHYRDRGPFKIKHPSVSMAVQVDAVPFWLINLALTLINHVTCFQT